MSDTTPAVPRLRQVYFYLTEGCNLACRHCWLAPKFDADGSRYATLSEEDFRQVIREGRPLGLRQVKLTGGEPMLHPAFDRLLEIARDEEMGVGMETNGLLANEARAAAMARCRDAYVSVSLDGKDAATHEWLRGVPGSFDKACRAVRLFAGAGVWTQVITTLVRRNLDQAEAMVDLARQLGARSIKFNILQPTARGASMRDSHLDVSVAELIALGRRMELEIAPQAGLKVEFDHPVAFRPLSRLAAGSGTCGILGILGVISTGHYALCGIGMQIPELVFGKVGRDALQTVWSDHPVLRELRAGMPGRLEGVCGRCLMKQICLASCIAQNYYSSGCLWAPFWFCRDAEREGLFPETRLARPSGEEKTGSRQQGGAT
jgi:SynChlorMet cassette radical SAM/SPASM protein ScmF